MHLAVRNWRTQKVWLAWKRWPFRMAHIGDQMAHSRRFYAIRTAHQFTNQVELECLASPLRAVHNFNQAAPSSSPWRKHVDMNIKQISAILQSGRFIWKSKTMLTSLINCCLRMLQGVCTSSGVWKSHAIQWASGRSSQDTTRHTMSDVQPPQSAASSKDTAITVLQCEHSDGFLRFGQIITIWKYAYQIGLEIARELGKPTAGSLDFRTATRRLPLLDGLPQWVALSAPLVQRLLQLIDLRRVCLFAGLHRPLQPCPTLLHLLTLLPFHRHLGGGIGLTLCHNGALDQSSAVNDLAARSHLPRTLEMFVSETAPCKAL